MVVASIMIVTATDVSRAELRGNEEGKTRTRGLAGLIRCALTDN